MAPAHVIFEISWTSDEGKELQKMNDIMNQDHGFPGLGGFPTVGYLIKTNFQHIHQGVWEHRPSNMVGIDIYRVHRGTTIQNAQHWKYQPGGPEVLITITAADLGITGFWGVDALRHHHKVFCNVESNSSHE